jgi:hypothetical protein
MANPSGAKGYRGEFPIVEYLKRRGFKYAYRLKQQGVQDKGDVGHIEDVVIEVKNVAKYALAEWMKELAYEKRNARAVTGAVVMKPKGIGDTRVGDWWAVLTLEDYVGLLIGAGYGPFENPEDHDDPVEEPRLRR